MGWLERHLLRMARGYLLAWAAERLVWCTQGSTPLHGPGTVLVLRDPEVAELALRVAQRAAERPETREDLVAGLRDLVEAEA